MDCFGLHIRNLPKNITVEQLKGQLALVNGHVFHNQIVVSIYEDGNKITAVVSNISAEYEDLEFKCRTSKIYHRNFVVRQDYGLKRDENGDLEVKQSEQEREHMYGSNSSSIITTMFKEEFLAKIAVVNGEQFVLYLRVITPTLRRELHKVGRLHAQHFDAKMKMERIEFETVFQCFQAVRKMNNPPSVEFLSGFGTISICNDLKGLGKLGQVISPSDMPSVNSVVKFEAMDEEVLDYQLINTLRSFCWRCRSPFVIIGFQIQLKHFVGRCMCSYRDFERNEPLNDKIAYHFDGEEYTRLGLAQSTDGSDNKTKRTKLFIIHKKMLPKYEDAAQLMNIALPVLQEEWLNECKTFTGKYKCDGIVQGVTLFESILLESGKTKRIYHIKITVRRTEFWRSNNLRLGVVNISRYGMAQGRKAVIKKVTDGDGFTNLCVSTDFQNLIVFEVLKVRPLPDHAVYMSNLSSIRQWTSKEQAGEVSNVFNALLNKTFDRDVQSMLQKPDGIQECISDLNNKQQELAVKRALRYAVSIIQGPPGTGKTYVAAIIVHLLVAKCTKRNVLVLSQSNVAVDQLAHRIGFLEEKFRAGVKVLRIYSRKRERNGQGKEYENSRHIFTLHGLVKKSTRWLKIPLTHESEPEEEQKEMAIVQKILNDEEYLLTKGELNTYNKHVYEIEKGIMNKFAVFACTVSTAADSRIAGWLTKDVANETHGCQKGNKDEDSEISHNQCKIGTILFEEAGQLQHAHMFGPIHFNPERVVLVGDQLQLQAVANSVGASASGLCRSFMDCNFAIRHCVESAGHIPWTLLLQQFRMYPKISEVVSETTYGGKLKNAPSVFVRNFPYSSHVKACLEEFQVVSGERESCLGVFDCVEEEQEAGTSFMNLLEACRVSSLAIALMEKGVPESSVTIITFYEAQRVHIKATLQGTISENVRVINCDGFQGGESDIVLLSFVRSNRENQIGFTSVSNRLNVGISRARYFLFIYLNYNHFLHSPAIAMKYFLHSLKKNAVFYR